MLQPKVSWAGGVRQGCLVPDLRKIGTSPSPRWQSNRDESTRSREQWNEHWNGILFKCAFSNVCCRVSIPTSFTAECVKDLDLRTEMIIFRSILTTFKFSIVLIGSWGSIENWLEPKTETLPSGNLACPNPWNALYNYESYAVN